MSATGPGGEAAGPAVFDRHLELTLAELLAPAAQSGPAGIGQPGIGPARAAGALARRLVRTAVVLAAAAIVVAVALERGARRAAPPRPRTWWTVPQDPAPPPGGAAVVRTAADLAELPEDTTAVECVRLEGPAFAKLRRLARLEQLTVSGRMVDDGMFFEPYPLPRDALEAAAALPRLRVLRLEVVDDLDARQLASLQRLPLLEELHLRRIDWLADDHFEAVAALPALRRLWLEGCGDAGDAALGRLLGATQLDGLVLRGTYALTAAGYRQLAEQRRLQRLDLSAPWYLADAGAVTAGGWPDGRTDAVDDGVLAVVGRLTTLRVLGLGARRRITDAGLAHLRALERLTALDLAQCHGITAAGLAALPGTLRELVLDETPRVAGVPAHLGALRRLSLRGAVRFDDDAALGLAAFPGLLELDLSDCPSLSAACVDAIAALSGLRVLRLRGHAWLDDAALAAFARCRQLRTLHVGSYEDRHPPPVGPGLTGGRTAITGAGVARLAALAELRELDLSAAQPLPVAALRALGGLPLAKLMLAWTVVEYDERTPDLAALRSLWPEARVEWFAPVGR